MNKREDWWEYTKRIIRSYPALRRKAESVGDIPCTPAYGASGGHSGGGSPVERAVVDRLTDKEQRRYDAVQAAISETERMKHGHQRMELIDRVYWKRSHLMSVRLSCYSSRPMLRWNWRPIVQRSTTCGSRKTR
ncbi:hypothetical protein [Agathobaculum sp.]|uniref:hypothetical protein n=1 Tax=Agathobaculum sp. TaxID=2048138 RepID=UPI003A8CE3E2